MRILRALAVGAACATAGLTVAGCGSTGLGAAPLQASLGAAFTNLYVHQQAEMGDPRPDPGSLRTTASCVKGVPADRQSGAGNDWVCHVTYLVAGPATPVVATYTVELQTDGCYAADGDGPASVNGTRTITTPDHGQVVNPLSLIDGCFAT